MKNKAANGEKVTGRGQDTGSGKDTLKEKHHPKKQRAEPENENLGLDADHSSEPGTDSRDLNHDNDRISGNPDGESDHSKGSGKRGYSPLMDK